MAREFHLLIDDVRTIEVDMISRTARAGMRALEDGEVTHLYLDNDLGADQPMEGIDILKWARDNDCVPDNVFLITANPIAKRRMEELLQYDLGYSRKGHWWIK